LVALGLMSASGESVTHMPPKVLPGTRAETVLDALTGLSNRLSNVGTGDKWAVLTGYLRWANDAADQLSTVVSAQDVAHLVLTRRHWAIQGIAPPANEALMSLLQLEIRERSRVFTAAHDDLQRAIDFVRRRLGTWRPITSLWSCHRVGQSSTRRLQSCGQFLVAYF
jgi:hypothetical protein